MTDEYFLKEAKKLLEKHGKISIVLLQSKLKVNSKKAKEMFEMTISTESPLKRCITCDTLIQKEGNMPTKNPRVNVTFNESNMEILHLICKKKKVSMSGLVRKVMEDWLEDYEDMLLDQIAEEVEKQWEKEGSKTISHEDLWRQIDTQ